MRLTYKDKEENGKNNVKTEIRRYEYFSCLFGYVEHYNVLNIKDKLKESVYVWLALAYSQFA